MNETSFTLDWPVYETYRLATTKGPPAGSTLAAGEPHRVIWRSGDAMRTYNPFVEGVPYRAFAECATEDNFLMFTRKYGFVIDPHSESCTLDTLNELAFDLTRLMAVGAAKAWATLETALQENKRGVGALGLVYEWREGLELPAIKFRPQSLADAMRVQLLLDLAGGTEMRKCKNPACHIWIYGAEHPSNKEYHSKQCREAHRYAKRKEGQS